MTEKIVDILIHILTEARRLNKPIGEIELTGLEQKGYSQTEITSAYDWLVERPYIQMKKSKVEAARDGTSFRILHDAEKMVISPEAFGYLLQLKELQIVSDLELELVIERVLLGESDHCDISTMQMIVTSVLFDPSGFIQPRSGIIIQGNDTIH